MSTFKLQIHSRDLAVPVVGGIDGFRRPTVSTGNFRPLLRPG